MSKKEFTSGLDILLRGSGSEKMEDSQNKVINNYEVKEKRATFIVNEEHVHTLKALAYWQRKQIKQIIKESLELYFSQIPVSDMNSAIDAYKKTK